MAVQTLAGKDRGESGGSVAGHAHGWRMVCRLSQSKAMSLLVNASAIVDESPPPMPMGGRRYSLGRRQSVAVAEPLAA